MLSLKERKYINNSKIKVVPSYEIGTEPGTLNGITSWKTNNYANQTAPNYNGAAGDYARSLAPSITGLRIPTEKDLIIKNFPDVEQEPENSQSNFSEKLESVLPGAIGFVGLLSLAGKSDVTEEEMFNAGGVSEKTIRRERYRRQNINATPAMERTEREAETNTLGLMASGAATGSKFGWIGSAVGAVGGLFGGLISGDAKKREAERVKRRALYKANVMNERSFDNALANALQKDEIKNAGNNESQMLYGMTGIEPSRRTTSSKQNNRKMVHTDSGVMPSTHNGYVSKGETMWKIGSPLLHEVNDGPNDTAKAYIDEDTVVFPDSIVNPFTGRTFADDSKHATSVDDLYNILNDQINTKKAMGLYKNKNIRKYNDGIEPFIPAALNAYIALSLLTASRDRIATPKSYVSSNTDNYLRDLRGLDINVLPIYNENRNATARANNAIRMSGGLGAGQLAIAYLNNANNERDYTGKAIAYAQDRKNALISDWAKAGINTKLLDAARKQNSIQWDYTQEANSHNNALQNNQMGWYNMSNLMLNLYKNILERRQYKDILSQYRTDNSMKRKYLNYLMTT